MGMSGAMLESYYRNNVSERAIINGQYYGSGRMIANYHNAKEEFNDGGVLPEVVVKGNIWGWRDWRDKMAKKYGVNNPLDMAAFNGFIHSQNMRNPYARAASYGYMPFNPEAIGLTLSLNVFGISGISGSVNFGIVGQQAGIWYSTGVGAGSPDVSGGISLFMAEYHGIEGATLSSYMGEGDAFSGSLGPIGSIYGLPVSLAGSYGRGFDASGVTSWSTYSGGLSIGNPNINWSSIRGKTYVLGGIINGSYQRTYSGLIWP